MKHIDKFYEQFIIPESKETLPDEVIEDIIEFDEIKDTFLLEDAFIHPSSSGLPDHQPIEVPLIPEDSDA